jgi:NSS family neurotransmitter:Na+ symporter
MLKLGHNFQNSLIDKKILHDELNSGGHLPIYLYKAIVFILRFIAPIGIGFVFINELGVL